MEVGNRNLLGDSNYAAELWAGGDPALANIGTTLADLGASLVDTTGEQMIPGNGLTDLVSFDLETGMGLSPGDPLWLRLTQVGIGGSLGTNDAVLFDSLTATPIVAAAVPEPSSLLLWGMIGAVMFASYRFGRMSKRRRTGHAA